MILLGSSGSIGINTLEIARKFHLEVETLGVGYNIALLNQQILEFNPKNIIIASEADTAKITSSFKGKIYCGEGGILEAIKDSKSNLVINALVGFLGLSPTLYAIKSNKIVALANKESLVVGGEFIDTSKIIPIDSEHFALNYLMNFNPTMRPFKNLYITASGGALRDTPLHLLKKQDAQLALQHPNWQMGKKITIDSSTMANKLFEVLEAFWLFKSKNIDAFIEKNSHIHALVEFWDGSIVAHFANCNMQLPIAYALCFGLKLGEEFLNNFSTKPLITPLKIHSTPYCLQPIDTNRYPLWGFKDLLLENPKLGVIFNAANEIAVEAFLNNKITFGGIEAMVKTSLKNFLKVRYSTPQELLEFDKEIRDFTEKLIN
ncbi:1-deoxy-D-xylulose-5-phosphate reductoisomerase [Helicobacter apodemus]|uniref:1-deoxy-D-xylulose 5-phosphate reductoisomerase n=1 Tax=Helicobacter apodemus TaxID=135569 RepID=A0A4U8UDI4_9HELI|nr:1-deoxy-D-xylulose-5-phosphate reductoisomerase [Helicobacter apodemus]TLE14848.1 1-deoxy-D-xylulose-5-phosphate reductoisomerase [Helicobacter apodemus]